MKEQTKIDVLHLCDAAKLMLRAANNLWLAHNPDEASDGLFPTPMPLEEAEAQHADAWTALDRAEYYARKSVMYERIERNRE